MMTLSTSYRKALFKKRILPWVTATLTLLLAAAPLTYWQYQQTQQVQRQYQQKLTKLKKTQTELNRLITEINKFHKAQKQLKKLSSLNLFKTYSRDQWADILLLHAAARVLPDIQYTLGAAQPVPEIKNLYTYPLHISLTGYHELEPLQLYQSLRQTTTSFIEWQGCKWSKNTITQSASISAPTSIKAGQQTNQSSTNKPFNAYITQLINQQTNFTTIQTACNFRVFYASPPQTAKQPENTITNQHMQETNAP